MTPGSVNADDRPSVLGIWRLGRVVHASDSSEICLAQPADATASPRWDYVIKRALNVDNRPANRQIVMQAARVAQSVSHPNLVCVLDGSVSGSAPFVVMPRIAGATIKQLIDQRGVKQLPFALWLTRQAAQAVESLHGAGWIHGDIKPANLMVNEQGHLTLIDLGFAHRIHTPLGKVFRGTPEYASPEQLEGNTAALASMDMFSIGRILWQLLTQLSEVNEAKLVSVADLVEQLVDCSAESRPHASEVVQRLLQLEIDTLGGYIEPDQQDYRRVA